MPPKAQKKQPAKTKDKEVDNEKIEDNDADDAASSASEDNTEAASELMDPKHVAAPSPRKASLKATAAMTAMATPPRKPSAPAAAASQEKDKVKPSLPAASPKAEPKAVSPKAEPKAVSRPKRKLEVDVKEGPDAPPKLNSRMSDRELLWWICGRVHLLEGKSRRNQEQIVDLTQLSSKLDEIQESQTAATARMKVTSPLEFTVDSGKVKQFVSHVMSTQQCWANFGNVFYKPLQLEAFGSTGSDPGIIAVRVFFLPPLMSNFFISGFEVPSEEIPRFHDYAYKEKTHLHHVWGEDCRESVEAEGG